MRIMHEAELLRRDELLLKRLANNSWEWQVCRSPRLLFQRNSVTEEKSSCRAEKDTRIALQETLTMLDVKVIVLKQAELAI